MRKIIFFVINSILLGMIPLYFVFIDWPYGFVMLSINIIAITIFDIIIWTKYILRFPINDYKEYSFNIKNDLTVKNDTVYFYLKKNVNNQYQCKINEAKSLVFDMQGCISPIICIKAYIIRQFYFVVINKNKLRTDTIGKNFSIANEFGFSNVIIKYKNKDIYLIKSCKTKLTRIMKEINILGVGIYMSNRSRGYDIYKYKNISEKDYIKEKRAPLIEGIPSNPSLKKKKHKRQK